VKQSHKTLLLWVLLIMIFLGIWTLLSPNRPPAAKADYTQFLTAVEADRTKDPFVEKVTIKNGDYIYSLKNPAKGTVEKKLAEGPEEVDANLVEKLRKNGVTIVFEKEEDSPLWSGALVTIIPMVLVLGMF
jgi:cell division protease FtsH